MALTEQRSAGLDVARVRKDFPILERTVEGKPLVYLDSAATSQKPNQVIDAEADFYRRHNANAHRGSTCSRRRRPSVRAGARGSRGSSAPRTRARSCSRAGRPSRRTSWPTPGRGSSCGRATRSCSEMEHHSTSCRGSSRDTGAVLRYLPITDDGSSTSPIWDRS